MTEDEEMRMIVEELGVGANPNEIAKALHNWFDNVPENPRDDLWREVHYLLYEAGYDPPDCTSGGLMPIGLCSCAWRRSPSIGMCTRKATLLGVGNRWLTRKHICRI
jgi:hypothetical protein